MICELNKCRLWKAIRDRDVTCGDQKMGHCESCKVPNYFGFFHNGKKFSREFILKEDFDVAKKNTEDQIMDMRESLDRLESLVKTET